VPAIFLGWHQEVEKRVFTKDEGSFFPGIITPHQFLPSTTRKITSPDQIYSACHLLREASRGSKKAQLRKMRGYFFPRVIAPYHSGPSSRGEGRGYIIVHIACKTKLIDAKH